MVVAPAQEAGRVAEAMACEVVRADLDDQSRLEGLPLARALGAPAAGTARRAPGEAGRLDQWLQLGQERSPGRGREPGSEADVVEQPVRVVEAEQQRADEARARSVARSPDDAVDGPAALDLLHAGALAGLVGQVEA